MSPLASSSSQSRRPPRRSHGPESKEDKEVTFYGCSLQGGPIKDLADVPSMPEPEILIAGVGAYDRNR